MQVVKCKPGFLLSVLFMGMENDSRLDLKKNTPYPALDTECHEQNDVSLTGWRFVP
jgi:hypothetical protein